MIINFFVLENYNIQVLWYFIFKKVKQRKKKVSNLKHSFHCSKFCHHNTLKNVQKKSQIWVTTFHSSARNQAISVCPNIPSPYDITIHTLWSLDFCSLSHFLQCLSVYETFIVTPKYRIINNG